MTRRRNGRIGQYRCVLNFFQDSKGNVDRSIKRAEDGGTAAGVVGTAAIAELVLRDEGFIATHPGRLLRCSFTRHTMIPRPSHFLLLVHLGATIAVLYFSGKILANKDNEKTGVVVLSVRHGGSAKPIRGTNKSSPMWEILVATFSDLSRVWQARLPHSIT